MRLVLYDIDGTLLTSHSVTARAFRAALRDVFGTDGPREGFSFAGKTDPQIAHELLTAAGVARERIEAGMPALFERYLARVRRELTPADTTVFPGVRELLGAVEAEGERAVPGLLTGNVREGARIKLDVAGLGFSRFLLGAFGSDHADRPELPALAIRRAERLTGHRFRGSEVVIIGDTPADIACGAHLGVRTLAVATGSYSAAQLAACRPDRVFEDLADTDAVLAAIFG
jgi:phosphoglycolate phosphatase-like HAD superfamily hydrolase